MHIRSNDAIRLRYHPGVRYCHRGLQQQNIQALHPIIVVPAPPWLSSDRRYMGEIQHYKYNTRSITRSILHENTTQEWWYTRAKAAVPKRDAFNSSAWISASSACTSRWWQIRNISAVGTAVSPYHIASQNTHTWMCLMCSVVRISNIHCLSILSLLIFSIYTCW